MSNSCSVVGWTFALMSILLSDGSANVGRGAMCAIFFFNWSKRCGGWHLNNGRIGVVRWLRGLFFLRYFCLFVNRIVALSLPVNFRG